EAANKGQFREDLYYRLHVASIELPPLRDRQEDIPLLFEQFAHSAATRYSRTVPEIKPERVHNLTGRSWPGNVREMQNEIQRMLVMGDENTLLGAELLSPHVLMSAPPEMAQEISLLADMDGSLKERIGKMEANILRETLIRHRWNKSAAAKELGLSRVGLRGKLERYGLEKVEGLDQVEVKKVTL
ncbi:MAG: sigma-54-dependent Fis family transcriptional regulator, partial [Hyphomicrobiaceae bacterium]|nr:sigma-54-dependent Fis family transcriptional regulator [Hyphomicrobiaceae bacterium]